MASDVYNVVSGSEVSVTVTERVLGALNNLSAITGPEKTDDTTAGYSVGSLWLNTIAKTYFRATSVDLGSSVWARLNQTTPELFGAEGSGIKNDSEALNSTFTSSSLIFLSEGKTYSVSDVLLVGTNRKIFGYNATIKRPRLPKTELTSAAAEGVNTISVDDTTGGVSDEFKFKVGDEIVVLDPTGTYGGKGDDENSLNNLDRCTITDIDDGAGTLTFSTTFGVGLKLPATGNLDGAGAYPTGSVVVKVQDMFHLGNENDDIQFHGVTFDGNKAENDWTYDWRLNNTGAFKGDNILFKDCLFVNLPSENIQVSAGVTFDNCWLINSNGGLCHVTNPDGRNGGVHVLNCKGFNTNLKPKETGHSESFVTMSWQSTNVRLINNYVINDTRIKGNYIAGAMNGEGGDANLVIIGGYYKNFGDILNANVSAAAYKIHGIKIEGVDLVNCGDVDLNGSDFYLGDRGIYDVSICNNTITNGRVWLDGVVRGKCNENTFINEDEFDFSDPANVYKRSQIFFFGREIEVKGNKGTAPVTPHAQLQYGIKYDGGSTATTYYYTRHIDMSDNKMSNYPVSCIESQLTKASNRVKMYVNFKLHNNTVKVPNGITGGLGMSIEPGQLATLNTAFCNSGDLTTYGIYVRGLSTPEPDDWDAGTAYTSGNVRKFDGNYYEANQATSAGESPATAPEKWDDGNDNVLNGPIVLNNVHIGSAPRGLHYGGNSNIHRIMGRNNIGNIFYNLSGGEQNDIIDAFTLPNPNLQPDIS